MIFSIKELIDFSLLSNSHLLIVYIHLCKSLSRCDFVFQINRDVMIRFWHNTLVLIVDRWHDTWYKIILQCIVYRDFSWYRGKLPWLDCRRSYNCNTRCIAIHGAYRVFLQPYKLTHVCKYDHFLKQFFWKVQFKGFFLSLFLVVYCVCVCQVTRHFCSSCMSMCFSRNLPLSDTTR